MAFQSTSVFYFENFVNSIIQYNSGKIMILYFLSLIVIELINDFINFFSPDIFILNNTTKTSIYL